MSPTELSRVTSVVYCQEAKQLLDEFAATVQELVQLHQQQFLAVVAGDPDGSRFDDLIHMANEKKHQAKYAYLRHLEAHGCSTFDGSDAH